MLSEMAESELDSDSIEQLDDDVDESDESAGGGSLSGPLGGSDSPAFKVDTTTLLAKIIFLATGVWWGVGIQVCCGANVTNILQMLRNST